jgi:hypothetical protein
MALSKDLREYRKVRKSNCLSAGSLLSLFFRFFILDFCDPSAQLEGCDLSLEFVVFVFSFSTLTKMR